jgi:hypothetical protein
MVLVMSLREFDGREASPSGGVIDKGRKRHILTDYVVATASW